MTFAHARSNWSPIGAIELKSTYRRNMTEAMVAVILFFATIIGGTAIGRLLFFGESVKTVRSPVIMIDPTKLGLPPALIQKTTQIKVTVEKTIPAFAIPEPADDETVTHDYVVSAPEDYAQMAPLGITDSGVSGGFVLAAPPDSDIFPAPGIFVYHDEEPIIVSLPTPKYPDLARRLNIEGRLRVEVLIDKSGKVRDARVIEGSGTNVGFEEAALEAAWKGEWRPAMQNKQPVAVRVSYPVIFKLR